MSDMESDAEREVEDFFNEEILGLPTERPDQEPPFPSEPPPPEPKPLEEVTVEEDEPGPEPEGTPEEDISAPDSEEAEETPANVEPTTVPEADSEDDYLAWAKKQYGEDLDPEKLAKAAYEKEKLLGKQAEETRKLAKEREALELQARIDALNTPGNLTSEEESWVEEAVTADDPGEWAYNALQAERPDLYAAVMDRWGSLGETEARRARVLHSRVLQMVTQPQATEQETYAASLGQTFISLGLNIEQHGPLILQKAEELGSTHPAVQGMMSPDDDMRRLGVRAVYDLVGATSTSVVKARQDDQVSARVQEEQLRQNASGVTTGGPRVEPEKKSPFWDQFDEEISQRGWDGERPAYGREE